MRAGAAAAALPAAVAGVMGADMKDDPPESHNTGNKLRGKRNY